MVRPKRRTAVKRPNQKGYAFEREVAHFLTDLSGIEYSRVGVSEASDREHYPGDIKRTDKTKMSMVIECKSSAFYLEHLYRPSLKFLGWLKQLWRDEKAAFGDNDGRWILAIQTVGRLVFLTQENRSDRFKGKILDWKKMVGYVGYCVCGINGIKMKALVFKKKVKARKK